MLQVTNNLKRASARIKTNLVRSPYYIERRPFVVSAVPVGVAELWPRLQQLELAAVYQQRPLTPRWTAVDVVGDGRQDEAASQPIRHSHRQAPSAGETINQKLSSYTAPT